MKGDSTLLYESSSEEEFQFDPIPFFSTFCLSSKLHLSKIFKMEHPDLSSMYNARRNEQISLFVLRSSG